MRESEKKKTAETEQIETLLRETFPRAEVYRYNSASIRVRIVDKRFKGKSAPERDAMVSPRLARLPEDIEADITMVLLVAPDETEQSVVNLEFEHPSPSAL